jgi:serine protease Do
MMAFMVAWCLAVIAGFRILTAEEPPRVAEDSKPAEKTFLSAETPTSIEELKALEKVVRELLPKISAASIAVQVGEASGSGVIIDQAGHVLTAAHVVGEANRDALFVLPDGKVLKGKTLGANHDLDAGLMKITEKAEFPYLEMGDSGKLKPGSWCLSLGHPGGFQRERSPVVRLGRVLSARKALVVTDCTIMPGDSGGPLLDLEGKVIGIHSRIGGALTANIHVPISAYQEGWERLANGEVWGRGVDAGGPYLGVIGDPEARAEAKLAQINPNSPAAKAGLKAGDVILKLDGAEIKNFDALTEQVRKLKPGKTVVLNIKRDEETLEIKLKVGRRPEN